MGEKGKRAEAVVPEEVTRLLEERAKVQGWLERLVEHREEATPDVFRKVETDYRERLEGVNGRLSAHRADLEASLARHRERVQDLEGDRESRARELEEAKLRHAVGEYDDQTWTRRREEGEEAIAGLDERLADARGALAELSGVLAALPNGDGGRDAAAATAERPVAPARRSGDAPAEAARAAERQPTGKREQEPTREAARAAEREATRPEEPEAARASEPEAAGGRRPGTETAEREVADAEGAATVQADGEDRFTEGDRGRSDAEFMDELEFLESLSLEDAERFDAVSAMLEGEEEEEAGEEGRS